MLICRPFGNVKREQHETFQVLLSVWHQPHLGKASKYGGSGQVLNKEGETWQAFGTAFNFLESFNIKNTREVVV